MLPECLSPVLHMIGLNCFPYFLHPANLLSALYSQDLGFDVLVLEGLTRLTLIGLDNEGFIDGVK